MHASLLMPDWHVHILIRCYFSVAPWTHFLQFCLSYINQAALLIVLCPFSWSVFSWHTSCYDVFLILFPSFLSMWLCMFPILVVVNWCMADTECVILFNCDVLFSWLNVWCHWERTWCIVWDLLTATETLITVLSLSVSRGNYCCWHCVLSLSVSRGNYCCWHRVLSVSVGRGNYCSWHRILSLSVSRGNYLLLASRSFIVSQPR